MRVLGPVPGCLDYSSFVVQADLRYCDSHLLEIPLFQDCWGYSRSFSVGSTGTFEVLVRIP